jgi:hypothetical protein
MSATLMTNRTTWYQNFILRYYYSRTPLIRKLVIPIANYPEAGYPDRQLSGSWLSRSPVIRKLAIPIANYPEAGYHDR